MFRRMENDKAWHDFEGRMWKQEINVRDFIQKNYHAYDGDESFLEGPTEATKKLWDKVQVYQKVERAQGGILDMETKVVSSLTSYGAGYIDEDAPELEKIVGLQTDLPLKRAFMPFGGIKMAEQACTSHGYEPDPELHRSAGFLRFRFFAHADAGGRDRQCRVRGLDRYEPGFLRPQRISLRIHTP